MKVGTRHLLLKLIDKEIAQYENAIYNTNIRMFEGYEQHIRKLKKKKLLVYSSMLNIEHRQLREELMRDKPQPQFLRDMKLKNSFDMYKGALNKSPKEYLGWNDAPQNPEYQRMRKSGEKLIDKVIEQVEEGDNQ
ncbi:hypothetical protein [Paenibacillus graminis]|nr:hypothetical protein [Paenibacillus graminis]MEC0170847.1 hypothetical protein [Paenibacillus graminis]